MNTLFDALRPELPHARTLILTRTKYTVAYIGPRLLESLDRKGLNYTINTKIGQTLVEDTNHTILVLPITSWVIPYISGWRLAELWVDELIPAEEDNNYKVEYAQSRLSGEYRLATFNLEKRAVTYDR